MLSSSSFKGGCKFCCGWLLSSSSSGITIASSRCVFHRWKRDFRSSLPRACARGSGTAFPIWRCICCMFVKASKIFKIAGKTHCDNVVVNGFEHKIVRETLRPSQLANCHHPVALNFSQREVHTCSSESTRT